jgi:hypothetical protein
MGKHEWQGLISCCFFENQGDFQIDTGWYRIKKGIFFRNVSQFVGFTV